MSEKIKIGKKKILVILASPRSQGNVESISDGVYIGECDVDFIYVKAEVRRKDGKIQGIKLLKHKNDRGLWQSLSST